MLNSTIPLSFLYFSSTYHLLFLISDTSFEKRAAILKKGGAILGKGASVLK